jgi:hypothetical protein
MATSPKEISFIVPGQLQGAASVRVGATRGNGDMVRLTARPGEDVVMLTVANGPTLVLHPENARDLLLAQSASGTRDGSAADGAAVSARLGWPGLEAAATRGATRGWMGEAVLSAFEVVTGVAKDSAVDFATAAITRKLDGAVNAGVYQLTADPLPPSIKRGGLQPANIQPAPDGGPLLVLVHGTFVDTVSTFGKLWTAHPQAVRDLFTHYGGRVYALDHPTLAHSPIANALTLVQAMPAGARLHLVTHSRGGLVAEILARACGGGALAAEELAFFKGAGYATHRAQLRELVDAAQAKRLKVERAVRVACPAHGTLLASKRLDAYLSVLRWGLELASVPVAPELVDFLHEVARRRADPAQLPGLEAMMPESPVVAWLNSRSEPVPGELRVVAGDMEGDSVGSWVKTLLSDAFYWTDNDLVVQTRSMYGGMARAPVATGPAASFMLDRGAKVSHFHYFANQRTVDAIAAALMRDTPEDFAAIGPLSWAGQDASGTRAAQAVARSRGPAGQAAERPAVVVLPGILGSNLKVDGKRIWLGAGFINALLKLEWNPATASRVEPDGPVDGAYDALIEHLAATHEVIAFAFDWRRPIEDEARRLAATVDAALAARDNTGLPIRLLAHSMGGLVARTMQLEKPATWRRMMAREGARLLMLGTPNGGSWSPMQTLSGDDTFGNTLAALGSLFDNRGARRMMAGLPGFIQLQAALLDADPGLARAATWQKLADDDMAALRRLSLWHEPDTQRAIYEWGAPPQDVLDQAVALRRRLDAQLPALAADAPKIKLVVGQAPFTPAGISMGEEGLEYLNTPDGGDGRVTLDNALLPGVATWTVDAVHGKLPDVQGAFDGYVELLEAGTTNKLQALLPGTRGEISGDSVRTIPRAALARSRPSRGLEAWLPPSRPADVMGIAREERARPRTGALAVSVRNGDLRFISEPLLIGHYRSLLLTGAEAAIDRLVDGEMSRALKAGLYPDAPGSHQVFRNKRRDPRNPTEMAKPAAALVAGLGEEGKLREVDLVYTVRQAVLAYAQRLSESTTGAHSLFDLAATLIGSGGTGITPGSAARAIAQGVLDANGKLQENGWPRVGQLLLIEQYLDRAEEAWHALELQERSAPSRLKLVGKIGFGPGALRRPLDSGYRGARHDFISALKVPGRDPAHPCITYTLDTRRARTEVRAQHAQGSLLRELVTKASNDANNDPLIGRTLFNLLVPMEIEPFLAGTGELVLEVDPDTASIPWEILDTNPDDQSADSRPWAIRSKLVRKLRIDNFRDKPRDATVDDSVLVIGEPLADPARYPRLEGARREAIAVAAELSAPGRGIPAERVHALVDQADAQTIINALFARPYRIVHVAGHGEAGANGGVVLSGDGIYLGSAEVEAMRVVPELVFLNCCHLAAREATIALPSYDRAQFAANIAESLIRVGVRCVVAAGWAVEDNPAADFAAHFYQTLLIGGRFIDAVGAGRAAALRANPSGNTWAAYQCYGDPEWTWRREGIDAQRPTQPLSDELAGVASPVSLTLALETLAIQGELGGRAPAYLLDRLRFVESEFAPLWGAMGAVAEAFGVAYAAAQDVDKAIGWYQAALSAQDRSASLRTADRLAELLSDRGGKRPR